MPYTNSEDITGATTAPDDPVLPCGYGQENNSVWYRYTAANSGLLTVDTFGSTYDTLLGIWTGNTPTSLTSAGCNDDASGTLQSQLQIAILAGQTYQIEIASYYPGGGQLTSPCSGLHAGSNIHAHRYAHTHQYTNIHAYQYTDIDTDLFANLHADQHPHCHADSHAHLEPYVYVKPHAQRDPPAGGLCQRRYFSPTGGG